MIITRHATITEVSCCVAETPQRTRNRRGEGERLRVEILDAAAALLSELGGEEGLTIRGVARATGIAPASIYLHFTDRAALVQGLLAYDFEQLGRSMRDADQQHEQTDVVGRVRAQMHAYCRFAIDHPGHYRLMINNGVLSPPDGFSIVDVVGQVIEALQRCEEAGHVLRMPAERAGIMVFVATHGRVALWHAASERDQVERIPKFVDEVVSVVFS